MEFKEPDTLQHPAPYNAILSIKIARTFCELLPVPKIVVSVVRIRSDPSSYMQVTHRLIESLYIIFISLDCKVADRQYNST